MAKTQKRLTSSWGDYHQLLAYRKAELIYDLTFYFVHNFLSSKDRTVDQMLQAARSGKQNIVEGHAAGVTSRQTAIFLTNVAKSSFLELRADYEDYLRVREYRQWEVDSREVSYIRAKCLEKGIQEQWFIKLAKSRPGNVVANMALTFLHQVDYLLAKCLEAFEKRILNEGGFRENMLQARLKQRNNLPPPES